MLYKKGVDFFIAIPNQNCGEKICLQLKELGLNYELQYDEEFEKWTCIALKTCF